MMNLDCSQSKSKITMMTIRAPDDFHLHLRDGERLTSLGRIPLQFKRAIVMPNLKPPVVTTEMALRYREEILTALRPVNKTFEPLMTLYFTDSLRPEEIFRAKASGQVYAVKLYPAGATTNSENGVTDIQKVYPTLKAMEQAGLLLLVHGEVTDPTTDIFDREKVIVLVLLLSQFE